MNSTNCTNILSYPVTNGGRLAIFRSPQTKAADRPVLWNDWFESLNSMDWNQQTAWEEMTAKLQNPNIDDLNKAGFVASSRLEKLSTVGIVLTVWMMLLLRILNI